MSGVPSTPVAIVGTGPVALVLALLLDRYGIPSTVLGAAGDGPDPTRAGIQGPRTMEHYRRLGVAGPVRGLGLPAGHPADTAWHVRWAQPEFARLPLPGPGEELRRAAAAPRTDQLPEPGHPADDARVAGLLCEHARTRPGITLRDGWQVVEVRQNAGPVRLRAVHPGRPGEEEWTAWYTVLAGQGPGRARLLPGTGYEPPGSAGGPPRPEAGAGWAVAARLRLPGFRRDVVAGPPARTRVALAEDITARLVCLDGAEEFALLASGAAQPPAGRDGVAALVRRAAGRGLPVEVLEHRRIEPGEALIARRFVSGRVLLAGDRAHPYTPYTGTGTDTGVEDAANLAWKLAAVLHGWGGPHLLTSYEGERRPAAVRAVSAARALGAGPAAAGPADLAADTPEAAAARRDLAALLRGHGARGHALLGVQLGARYDGSPVIAREPGTEPPGDSWGTYRPCAVPGGRAPHVWLDDWHGPGSSLFDRLGPGFTLLRLGPEPPGGKPLAAAAQAAGMPLTVLDVEGEAARDMYGRDLVLVRPDQYVAWRGNQLPTDPGDLVALVTGAGPDRHREAA